MIHKMFHIVFEGVFVFGNLEHIGGFYRVSAGIFVQNDDVFRQLVHNRAHIVRQGNPCSVEGQQR